MEEKTFSYAFSVDGPVTLNFFDTNPAGTEKLDVTCRDEEAHLYLNRDGLLAMAKLMVKLAEGRFEDGFCVHLSKDFAADDNIRLVLYRVPEVVTA